MKQRPEQETIVYPLSTAEKIVSSTLFFPSTLNDWFNLDLNIRNSESVSVFKSKLLSFSFLFAQFKLTYTIFLTQKV